jgi:hypothetical protein
VVLKAELSLSTLLTAMRNLGCGDPHPVFAGGLRYVPPSAVGQVNREAFEELSQYGFTQGDGFTPEFDELLHLLDRPATEFFAFARDLDEQISVLVATRGRTAVTALCQGGRVWLKHLSPDTHPVDALVANLPPCQPAPIKAFSLPQQEFQATAGSDIYDEDTRSRAAQRLDSLFQEPYYGVGQFYAAKRDNGVRVEAQDSVSYLDVEAGRVGIGLADRHISVLPGEALLLGRKVAALRSGLDA